MNSSEILLWDDNPSPVDLLGFEDVAAPVLDALNREHLDPVCIGVFGPWGAGKTTVIQSIAQTLDLDDATVVIYTQPWSYDPTTDPKATLIGEVLNAVRDHLDESTQNNLGDQLKSLAKRVRWSRAIRLAAESALTASLPKLSELEALFGEGDNLAEPTLQGFREEFEDLLQSPTLAKLRRVVVIVDDLDRCLPGTVIDTLEAIKLFLAVPKMAFVVAADEAPVAHAIASAFSDSPDGSALAKKYLEKIVQIPVRVPTLGLSDVEAYVAQLLLWHHIKGDKKRFEAVRRCCADARAAGKPTFVEGLAQVANVGTDDVVLAERLAPTLYEELGGNPRSIKRLLNAYWIRAAIARRRGLTFRAEAFAKLVLLEEVYPREFQAVLGWLAAGTLNEQLSQLEQGDGDFPAPLLRWGQLEPTIAELDVGRYLILAAALQGTIVTARALPPALREVAELLTSVSDQVRRAAQKDIERFDITECSLLATHVADAIRFQPSRQADLAESLLAIVKDSEEVASAAELALKRMSVADVEPALIISLIPPSGRTLIPFRNLVAAWKTEGRLSKEAARAAQMGLGASS